MTGISLADMRGQCYDGASNMSGVRSGVKAVVQEEAPKAMYYRCASHRLNLSVVSACSIQALKNVESYVEEILQQLSQETTLPDSSTTQPRDNAYWTKRLKLVIPPPKSRS